MNAVAWFPTSKHLASCSDDKTIRVWDMEQVPIIVLAYTQGDLVRVMTDLSQFPTCIAINPRGTIIACSCVDNHIYFFSLFTRSLLKTIYAHSNTITSIEFNIDGSLLISSSVDGYW